jgi:hypothetical protein
MLAISFPTHHRRTWMRRGVAFLFSHTRHKYFISANRKKVTLPFQALFKTMYQIFRNGVSHRKSVWRMKINVNEYCQVRKFRHLFCIKYFFLRNSANEIIFPGKKLYKFGNYLIARLSSLSYHRGPYFWIIVSTLENCWFWFRFRLWFKFRILTFQC